MARRNSSGADIEGSEVPVEYPLLPECSPEKVDIDINKYIFILTNDFTEFMKIHINVVK